MRIVYILLLFTAVSSCNFGTKTSEPDIQELEPVESTLKELQAFSEFIDRFPALEFPVVIQGCDENYEHLEETDSRSSQLLESDKNLIFGKVLLNEQYILALTLLDHDMCYLVFLTTYNLDGEEIDSTIINIGRCGPGPCDFCKETFILEENLNIYVEDFIINYQCDEKDFAILETGQKEILFKEGNIENGKIILSKQKQQKIDNPINIPKNVDENFETFLKYFSTDSLFQINRVAFPIKVQVADQDNDYKLKNEIIPLQNYPNLDFTYDESYKTLEESPYEQSIKINNNEAKLLIRGIDNGWYVDYIFKKIDGKWTLITWIDGST